MKFKAKNGKTFDLIIVDSHDYTGPAGAAIIEKTIRSNDPATICFSTGSTPLPLYRELTKMFKNGQLSFKNVRAFMLDEYVGLPAGHSACFRSFLEENLFRHIDLQPENLNFFFGPVEDHMQTCLRYEMALEETGGVDLMILGIGSNGHVAFNEPGTLPDSRTRLIKLTESTRQANARFFSSIGEVPTHAISIGIGNILEAKNLLLIADGEKKAEAIRKSFLEPVDNSAPASYLQNFGGNLTVILDKEAASGLNS